MVGKTPIRVLLSGPALGNLAAGPQTDVKFNFNALATFDFEYVFDKPGAVRGYSYIWLAGPAGVGNLTVTPFKGAAGAVPADPGVAFDVVIPCTAATQRGRATLTTPLAFAKGDVLGLRASNDAAWNVATADIHIVIEIDLFD